MLRFELLGKSHFDKISNELFTIFWGNMNPIDPTGNTFEDDFCEWYKAVSEGISKSQRNIILIYFGDVLAGFFQYYSNRDGLFMMEEIQVLPEFRGKAHNIFRELYGYVFSVLPPGIETVEAYTVKNNRKSQEILSRLGLTLIDTDKSGRFLHYCGEYKNLVEWHTRGSAKII